MLLLWAGMAQAQVHVLEPSGIWISATEVSVPDTMPVWIIYLDSVRLYASHPEYDIRLEVAPGWKIHYGWKCEWVDQEGKRFNADNIIMDRPRKPVRNPFKE